MTLDKEYDVAVQAVKLLTLVLQWVTFSLFFFLFKHDIQQRSNTITAVMSYFLVKGEILYKRILVHICPMSCRFTIPVRIAYITLIQNTVEKKKALKLLKYNHKCGIIQQEHWRGSHRRGLWERLPPGLLGTSTHRCLRRRISLQEVRVYHKFVVEMMLSLPLAFLRLQIFMNFEQWFVLCSLKALQSSRSRGRGVTQEGQAEPQRQPH